MPTNVLQFNVEVAASITDVESEAVELQKSQVLAFVEIVSTTTPVRTGFAQAQWANVSVGAKSPEIIQTFPMTPQQIRAMAAVRLRGLTFGQLVFTNNNADHISFLNEGSSSQASAGFIETAEASVNLLFP